jgi:hypothetical protein
MQLGRILTTESPIIHLFLPNSIENRVHISGGLGSIDICSVLAHSVDASLCSILCIGKHSTSFENHIPCTRLEINRSLLWGREAASSRNRVIDPPRIETKKVEVLSKDGIECSSCYP